MKLSFEVEFSVILDFPHFSLRGASRREIISKWRGCWRLCAVLPSRRGPRALPASAGIREIRMEHRQVPCAMSGRITHDCASAVKYALSGKEVASPR